MSKIKRSKNRGILILLSISLLILVACSKKVENNKIENRNFITITLLDDIGTVDIKFYDDNFDLMETRSIKNGWYTSSFETDDKYYLPRDSKLLSIDKNTKEIKEVKINFLESSIYDVIQQDNNFIFIEQIYNSLGIQEGYKIHDTKIFDEENIKTFTGTKYNASNLIKMNNKYYIISNDEERAYTGEFAKRFIEVFDNEGNFLYSNEIENPRSHYRFYKSGDNVYLISNDWPSALYKFDLEKGEIVKEPVMTIEDGGFHPFKEDLFVVKKTEVFKVSLDNFELEKVFDSTDLGGNTEDNSFIQFNRTNNLQLIKIYKQKEDQVFNPQELYIKSKEDKEFRKIEGVSIVDDLHKDVIIGDLN